MASGSSGDPGEPRRADDETAVTRLAALLCDDAARVGYDHGPDPTVMPLSTLPEPLWACPRHLGMAWSILVSLRSAEAAAPSTVPEGATSTEEPRA